MSEIVAFPKSEGNPETLDDLVKKVHKLSQYTEKVYFHCNHVKERMLKRNITSRQIFDVLRNGKGISGPYLDKYGDWRIKMKRYSAGRTVQVVIVIKKDYLEIVTVI